MVCCHHDAVRHHKKTHRSRLPCKEHKKEDLCRQKEIKVNSESETKLNLDHRTFVCINTNCDFHDLNHLEPNLKKSFNEMTSDVHHLVAMNQQVKRTQEDPSPKIHDVGMKLRCFKPRLFLSLPKDLQNHLKVMECWQIGQLGFGKGPTKGLRLGKKRPWFLWPWVVRLTYPPEN